MNRPRSIVCGTEWVVVWKPFRVGVHWALEVGVFGISGLSGGLGGFFNETRICEGIWWCWRFWSGAAGSLKCQDLL